MKFDILFSSQRIKEYFYIIKNKFRIIRTCPIRFMLNRFTRFWRPEPIENGVLCCEIVFFFLFSNFLVTIFINIFTSKSKWQPMLFLFKTIFCKQTFLLEINIYFWLYFRRYKLLLFLLIEFKWFVAVIVYLHSSYSGLLSYDSPTYLAIPLRKRQRRQMTYFNLYS